MTQAFLRLVGTYLAHRSLITEANCEKKLDMPISHLFHKKYLEYNGVIPPDKRCSILTGPWTTLFMKQIKEQWSFLKILEHCRTYLCIKSILKHCLFLFCYFYLCCIFPLPFSPIKLPSPSNPHTAVHVHESLFLYSTSTIT